MTLTNTYLYSQKAAKSEKHKKQTRLSRGEKRNRKRMAMVASVYGIDPHIRSAESIMGLVDKDTVPPKPRNKRVWASVDKPAALRWTGPEVKAIGILLICLSKNPQTNSSIKRKRLNPKGSPLLLLFLYPVPP